MTAEVVHPELSVIAPCYNEEGNVPELVRRMLLVFDTLPVPAELLLVDDGSSDATWERIQDAARADGRVRGEKHLKNRGIVGGWRTGLQVARADVVCLIDSDLQNKPEDVARLYEVYRRGGVDVVQGVRHPDMVHTRRLFSRGLNHLLNFAFRMNLRDNKSGFIVCTKEILTKLLEHRFRYRYFQGFIGAAMGVHRCEVAEVDTVFQPRYSGQSFLSNFPLVVSLRVLQELVKYRIETIPTELARR